MRWIGQHIWNFISRFRSDVYLEDTAAGTIASGGNLGLDSDNKIVKANVPSSVTISGSTSNGVATYGGAGQIDIESVTLASGTFANVAGVYNLAADLAVVSGGVLSLHGNPVRITSNKLEIPGSTASAGLINLYEDSDNGTNKVTLVGPADCTDSDKTITLPNATGTVALTNTHVSIIRASFWSSSTSGYYITLGGGSTSESTSLASSSYTTVFNCPFDGKVKRIAASTQATASKTVKLEMYIDKDDSDLVADQRGSDWNVSSYTNAWCEDSPGDWTFSKGENIAIKATDSGVVYGTQYSIVLEFDLTT